MRRRRPTEKVLPSGKHRKNTGKSPFLFDKSTISMAIFNSKLLVYQRVRHENRKLLINTNGV